jgi:hypothetical protein
MHSPVTNDSARPDPATRRFFSLIAIAGRQAYPSSDILAEIGRVTIAAARVDRQLALVLLALKHEAEWNTLLTWPSSRLRKELDQMLVRHFEGGLLRQSKDGLAHVGQFLEDRHSASHSIWSLKGLAALTSVAHLARATSPEELHQLLERDVAASAWMTLHPKNDAPGPQSIDDLQQIRRYLEESEDFLEGLRFRLASALFLGKPPGAKRVLDPHADQKPRDAHRTTRRIRAVVTADADGVWHAVIPDIPDVTASADNWRALADRLREEVTPLLAADSDFVVEIEPGP